MESRAVPRYNFLLNQGVWELFRVSSALLPLLKKTSQFQNRDQKRPNKKRPKRDLQLVKETQIKKIYIYNYHSTLKPYIYVASIPIDRNSVSNPLGPTFESSDLLPEVFHCLVVLGQVEVHDVDVLLQPHLGGTQK